MIVGDLGLRNADCGFKSIYSAIRNPHSAIERGLQMRVMVDFFALSDLLGVRRQFASLVLNGRFYRLHRERVPREAPEFAALFGVRRRVEALAPVSELFARKLSAEKGRIQAYCKRCVKGGSDPDFLNGLRTRLDLYRRLRFVLCRLIPALRRTAGSVKAEVDRSAELGHLKSLDGSFEGLASPATALSKKLEQANPAGETLGGDVLLVGQNVFELSWVPGDHRLGDFYINTVDTFLGVLETTNFVTRLKTTPI